MTTQLKLVAAMNKLYVGNLPIDADEDAVKQLFSDHNLTVADISVKHGGFAFVDFPDQSTADRAIDKLHGYNYSGLPLVVEPSVASKKGASVAMQNGTASEIPPPAEQPTDANWKRVGLDAPRSGGAKGALRERECARQCAREGQCAVLCVLLAMTVPAAPQPASLTHLSGSIIISGLPLHARFENIDPLLEQYGTVQNCESLTQDANSQSVRITFETAEQAQQAASGLNGYDFEGRCLKVEPVESAPQRVRRGRPGGGRDGARGFPPGQGRPADFPLRLLVQSDMVGAIIGRQGSTIRQITQQSRARVDVHRKDNVGSLEKAITIYGNPENCTKACKKILEVMQQEANNTSKGEICLKILAHNNLIGRIIGKGGNTIKRIMQDTETKITVSSINDINSFNLERIITVKGGIDNMARAESQISSKLRQSYENDLQVMAPQNIMFPGLAPQTIMAMMNTNRGAFCGAPPPFAPPMYAPLPGQSGSQQGAGDSQKQETTFLYIPNNAVGAIIGTKGSHIRNIIRFSSASVKIAPLEQDKAVPEPQAGAAGGPPQAERKVTIVGSPEAQWKAQYLIFEKMREEGFVSGTEDVRLTVEILVSSSQVGRIIGKGGQNVRELQRVTGSLIKLPEQAAAAAAAAPDTETTVHIVGPFFSVQSAQRRIRAMVAQAPGRHRRNTGATTAAASAPTQPSSQ